MGRSRGIRSVALSALALGGSLVVVGSIASPAAKAATVPIVATVRDFDHGPTPVNATSAHPDFEAEVGDEDGIVTDTLGNDGKPVYADNPSGTATTDGPASFNQWYRDTPGVNRSFPVTLNFDQTGSVLSFDGEDFFPADNKGWNDPSFNNAGQVDEGHNFSFTMELHLTFTYDNTTNQTFTFEGDDDVFVYFNKHLGIDLGGVHPAEVMSVELDDIAAEAGLVNGQTYPIDIFFAERHTSSSNFNIDANFAAAAAPTTTAGPTSSTSSTSTTKPTTTTTIAAAGATTTTTRPTVVANIVRTGSTTSPVVFAGIGLLAIGALLAAVDRHRYRGAHFLKN